MSAARLLIYGATGYTGELIAREAVRRGLQPVLAGRTEATVAALARELGCDYRIASLDASGALDRALQGWNAQMAAEDEGLALDGKTMCNALDADGAQTHILGVVGHQTQRCHTQKKSPPCPSMAPTN